MKNFKLLSLLFLSVLFLSSCNPDDDIAFTLNNANIAGTYDLTALSGTIEERDDFNGTTFTGNGTFLGSNFSNATVTFNENGTVSSTGEFDLTLNAVVNGTATTDMQTTDVGISGRYTILGNAIEITSLIDLTSITITDFTPQGFKLMVRETEIDDDYFYDAQGVYTFVKR